ncbi:AAA family ATPase [Serinibacter arcticus]|uniref:AAA family ATPase n=1 Tax=Serinibacter arcticus TaxID=1655435 RepID=UPI0011B1F0CD|nr:hypothetical protein [Serinibacter arcticus]
MVSRLEAPGSPARVIRRCADLAELTAAADAGLGDVAVLQLGRGVDAGRMAHLRRCGLGVVLVADATQASRGVAIGVDAVVTDGEGLADRLVAVIAEVLARRAETPVGRSGPGSVAAPSPAIPDDARSLTGPERSGRLVVVWGAHGAPGRTSTAVHLASELALAAPTMLVDADSVAPCLTQVLGVLEETAAVAALCRAAGQGALDPTLVRSRARTLPTGVALVSGLTRADRWRELAPDHLDLVWRAARRCASWIVVDVAGGLEAAPTRGADRWAATRSALHAADDVVVTIAGDPVGVRRGVAALTDLDAEGVAARRHLVATRVRPSRGGRTEEAVTHALERFAGTRPVAVVPQDTAFDDALLAGATLRETDPRSAARRAFAELARRLDPEVSGAPAPARRGVLARRRGATLA